MERKTITIQAPKAKKREKRVVHYGWASGDENGNIVGVMPEILKGLTEDAYIFSKDGKNPHQLTWSKKNFQKALDIAIGEGDIAPDRGRPKINRRINVRRLTFRDFRHVSAQRMRRLGFDYKTIADELGTSIELLDKVYLNEGEAAGAWLWNVWRRQPDTRKVLKKLHETCIVPLLANRPFNTDFNTELKKDWKR